MNVISHPSLIKEPTINQDEIKYGYFGLSSYPHSNPNRNNLSIYCASDALKGELFVIPLTIGFFYSMYQVLSPQIYNGGVVKMLPLSIEFDYISDLINSISTFNRLYKMENRPVVRWGFPKAPNHYTTEEFETAQERGVVFANQFNSGLTVTYYDSGVVNLYDVILQTEKRKKYFSLHMTEDKLSMLLSDTTVDEIHMCGGNSRHGGICGLDLNIKDMIKKNGYDKIRFFNFDSPAQLSYFMANWKDMIPVERWGDKYDEL